MSEEEVGLSEFRIKFLVHCFESLKLRSSQTEELIEQRRIEINGSIKKLIQAIDEFTGANLQDKSRAFSIEPSLHFFRFRDVAQLNS